jgi:RHS repeat-associated protein
MFYEPESSLYLTGLRAYDSQVGRFLQVDPLRQDPIGTLYTYARNRPFVFTDVAGLAAEPVVAPLRAASLDEDLQPEDLLPDLNVPDFALPQTVQSLQSEEMLRALYLLEAIRYRANDVVGRMDPLLTDFYLYDLNPMPATARIREAAPLRQILALYESGDGWLPNPIPDPTQAVDPFRLLDEVQAHVMRGMVDPLIWGIDPVWPRPIPTITLPSAYTPRLTVESALVDHLQRVPLAPALLAESETLLTLPQHRDPTPTLPLPQIEPPAIRLEVPVLTALDALREETYDLVQPLLPPFDCADCVPSLGFSE